jgi:uncharacterized RDD family membrane protein YckC
MSDQPGGTPAGWYPDPQGGGGQRYWDGQQWTDNTAPGQGGQPAAGGVGQAASAGIRFVARIIDGLVIGIPIFVVLAILGLAPTDAGSQLIYGLISSAVYVGYFVVMESSSGATIGKKALSLRTLGPDGGNPTQEQAFKRNAWILLGVIPLVGGFATFVIAIWIAVTIGNTGRGPHDAWGGGTMVVRTS